MIKLFATNKYHRRGGATYVNVMRGTPLGNPFVMKHESMRDEVVAKFRAYLANAIANNDEAICDELNRIVGLLQQGHTVHLECCCKPKACHADVIVEVINDAAK